MISEKLPHSVLFVSIAAHFKTSAIDIASDVAIAHREKQQKQKTECFLNKHK